MAAHVTAVRRRCTKRAMQMFSPPFLLSEIFSHSRRVPIIFTSAFGTFEVGKGVGLVREFVGNVAVITNLLSQRI